MALTKPLPGEYAEGYSHYLAGAPEGDGIAVLAAQLEELVTLYSGISEAQGLHRYAPEKWSLKDLLQHITDTERIFAYRCLRIGRGDTTPLAGFDDNAFAVAAAADTRPLADLVADFRVARESSLALFRSLTNEAWVKKGTSNGRELTTRCIPYLSLGHVAHHLGIIRERYLPGLK